MTKAVNTKDDIQVPVKREILGIGITYASKEEVLEYVDFVLRNKSKKLFVVTPNPEMITACHDNPPLAALLNGADLALCDGAGLHIAGQILGSRLKERIAGIDMVESLCRYAADQALNIGLLGARPGVAERAAECLREKYPSLKIIYTASEWDASAFPKNGLDMLFVAYGFPKQEQWINQHLVDVPISLAMGVGGSFDILSGDLSRAPFIMRMVGLEWLYRLVLQPWRWRRQLALISFIKLVLLARVRNKHN